MVRPTYTDLILLKSPSNGIEGASQTNLNNIITLLFKQIFNKYAHGQYDTYSSSQDHPTIDTTDVYAIVIRKASEIGNAILDKNWDDTVKFPPLKFDDEDLSEILSAMNVSPITFDFVNRQEDEKNGVY